jgi:hypothetical protein
MATNIFADRVKDTTLTIGTGAITLAGTAPTGYRTFAAAFGASSVPVAYCISDPATGAFETGNGTFNGTTGLARDLVLANSLNTTNKINFAAGTKDVFCTSPARSLVSVNANTGEVVIPYPTNAGYLVLSPGLDPNGTAPTSIAIEPVTPTNTNGYGTTVGISAGGSIGSGAAGDLYFTGGSPSGTGSAGVVNINAGSSPSSAVGGAVSIYGGDSVTAAGGGIEITSGTSANNTAGYGVSIGLNGSNLLVMKAEVQGGIPQAAVGFYGRSPVVQPTIALTTAAAFVPNTGTAINTGSTFDGYTLQQVVTALRRLGFLF